MNRTARLAVATGVRTGEMIVIETRHKSRFLATNVYSAPGERKIGNGDRTNRARVVGVDVDQRIK
jgi:hypothetical protein